MNRCDVIVIGAGVVGCSTAYHLAALGAGRVLVLDRLPVGAGTTAHSSGILRTHYSVPENVELARRSWAVFTDFAAYLGDEEASAGVVRCGYLIAAPAGPKLEPLRAALAAQQAMGIEVQRLSPAQAAERLPICRFDDAALIGFEPEAGFADAYLVASGFARAARRRGVRFLEGVDVQQLRVEHGRVAGVETSRGRFDAPVVVSVQNIWARDIERWTGIATPVVPERHTVLALQGPQPYGYTMPVYKDLGSPACCTAAATAARRCWSQKARPARCCPRPTTSRATSAWTSSRTSARRWPSAFRPSRPPGWPRRGPASTTSRPTGTRCSARCPSCPGWSSPTVSRATASSSPPRWAACWRSRRSACPPTCRWRRTRWSDFAMGGCCDGPHRLRTMCRHPASVASWPIDFSSTERLATDRY
jgi:hypothetical protein